MTEHTMDIFVGVAGSLPLRDGEAIIAIRPIRMAQHERDREDEFLAVTSLGRMLWVHHDSYFGEAHMRRLNRWPAEGSLDHEKLERANRFQAEMTLSAATEKLEATRIVREALTEPAAAAGDTPAPRGPAAGYYAYYLVETEEQPLPAWARWAGSTYNGHPRLWTAIDPAGARVKVYHSVRDFISMPMSRPIGSDGPAGALDAETLKLSTAALHSQLLVVREKHRLAARELGEAMTDATTTDGMARLKQIDKKLTMIGGAIKGLEFLISGVVRE